MNEYIRVKVVFVEPESQQTALVMTKHITHVFNEAGEDNKCLISLDTGEVLLVLGGVGGIIKKLTEVDDGQPT
jgi:hypothetical protein